MKYIPTIMAFTAILTVTLSGASGQENQEQTAQAFMELIPPDAISNVEVFNSNGFRIGSSRNKELGADLKPSGNQFDSLRITADGVFKVGIEKGRPMSVGGGVAIYHRDTGVPMLSTGDQTGDGRIDVLTYSVLDDGGKAIREVIDYDVDGQANLRIHFDEGRTEIWHEDRWHRIEERDGQRGIVLNGQFRKVDRIENRLWVQ